MSEKKESVKLEKIKKMKGVWIELSSVLDIKTPKMEILLYILENTDLSTDLFIGTYKKIFEDTNCSMATIARVLKKLQEERILKKIQNGVWSVNFSAIKR